MEARQKMWKLLLSSGQALRWVGGWVGEWVEAECRRGWHSVERGVVRTNVATLNRVALEISRTTTSRRLYRRVALIPRGHPFRPSINPYTNQSINQFIHQPTNASPWSFWTEPGMTSLQRGLV